MAAPKFVTVLPTQTEIIYISTGGAPNESPVMPWRYITSNETVHSLPAIMNAE